MRRLLCLPILLFAVACASSPEAADPPPEPVAVSPPSEASKSDGPPAEGQESSFWDNFVDDEDGAFDVSDFLDTPTGFLPLVVPITEPAVGFGLVGGLVFFHRDKDDDRPAAEKPPPSMSFAFGGGTTNGTWLAGGGHFGVWKDDHIRYTGILAAFGINLSFYGVGENGKLDDEPIDVTIRGWGTSQGAKFRIPDTDMFVGGQYSYFSFNNSVELSIPEIPPIEQDSSIGGIGPNFLYDTRDTIFTPNEGVQAQVVGNYYDSWLGSDFRFVDLKIQTSSFIPVHEDVVLGVRVDASYASQDAPFYAVPFVQLRGVPAMRYQGNYIAVAELEPRWNLTDRWALVVFGGLGKATVELSDFFDAETVWNVGTGFRYLLARKLGLYGGLDVARGPEDTAVYITVGTAWMR